MRFRCKVGFHKYKDIYSYLARVIGEGVNEICEYEMMQRCVYCRKRRQVFLAREKAYGVDTK